MIPNLLAALALDAAKRQARADRRAARRHHGVIVPWKGAAPKRVITARARQEMRDSTRSKRARRDREAMTR